MVTEAESEVGGVQLPNEPNLIVACRKTEVKDLVVVTVMYFLGEPPPVQVEVHETVVPAVHSQNTVLFAVTPESPVAFLAVKLMFVVSLEFSMPYWAPSRAPCSMADFWYAYVPRSN